MIEVNTNILGCFALKGGRIIKASHFPRDAKALAEKLLEVEEGLCNEEKELVSYLITTGTKEIKVRDPNRFSSFRGDIGLIENRKPTPLMAVASELGIPEAEVEGLISKANLEVTRLKMRVIGRDQMIMQAVASLDEIEESVNVLAKRLREWYSLNFPELDFLVKKHDLYAKLVGSDTSGVDEGLIGRIEQERGDTIGVEFSDEDASAVKCLSDSIVGLYCTEEKITEYIGYAMEDVAPNITALAGPTLGARLISIAGGLERLSKLPASTIQVLGAEDAFFRFLKTRRNPPKHGVIFQLPEIRSAPQKIRGKMSRMFAAKLAIAAKADWFSGEFIGGRLREDFLKKAEKLK